MTTITTHAATAKTLRLAANFLYSDESSANEVLLHDILCYLSWYLEADTVLSQRNHLGYTKELIGELYAAYSNCECDHNSGADE